MRLGFGTSVLYNGLKNKKLDGIGIYTQELWNVFEKEKGLTLLPFTFSKIQTALHKLLKVPFNELNSYHNNMDLFFAPDHYIPSIKNVPVVATVMDIIPIVHPNWASSRFRKLKNYLFKKTIYSADHIITISQYSKEDLIKHLGIPPEKISIVNLGVNERFFERVSENNKKKVLEKNKLKSDFFLFIGTLQPRKNIIRIIKAHRELPSEIKKDHPLVIVGKYGWNSQNLMDEIKLMTEQQDGIWLSYVEQDELYALLQCAIALVYPSLYEGFGLPVIEAFASKCPVITSNVTSLPEVAGDAALKVDPTSIEEINNAMYTMIKNSQLRETLQSRGSERVKKYNWHNVAAAHLEIFKEVLDKHKKLNE